MTGTTADGQPRFQNDVNRCCSVGFNLAWWIRISSARFQRRQIKLGDLRNSRCNVTCHVRISLWHDLVEGLSKGLPQAGDQGLDRTHTWGRTYWGGALFCTLADVQIHQRTSNRHGLQDALQAILAAGGSMETSWPLERALMVGDEATGVSVLTELYQQMKMKAVQCDLAGLWNNLGIDPFGEVSFNDQAPMAALRRAITAVPAKRTSCYSTFDNAAASRALSIR